MKVLVTGATGFLGSWLTKKLLDEGFDVAVLIRSKHKLAEELPGLQVEAREGDVTNLDSVQKAMTNVQGVFHLAGLVAYTRSERTAMERVNVLGTQNIVTACLEARVERLLHLSSVTAIGAGFTPDQVLNETSAYNIKHLNLGYFETKRLAEEHVIDACRTRGLNAVVLNPSTIYGPGDAKKGSRGSQLKVARGSFPFYPPGGVGIVHVDDVVDLCVQAFRHGKVGERTIVTSENLLIQDVFSRIAILAGVKPPSIALPRSVIFGLGHLGDALESVGLKGPINTENAWSSVLYHWFSNEKARRDFGFNPKPADAALEASVRWIKDNGLLK